jgi:hypothetical protein
MQDFVYPSRAMSGWCLVGLQHELGTQSIQTWGRWRFIRRIVELIINELMNDPNPT